MSFLTDGTVSLRPVEREDLAQLRDWRNDPEIRLRTREYRALNMADQQAWFERITGPDSRNFMFVVLGRLEKEDQPVGCVGLCHWSPQDRTAECSFYIGNPQAQGKGYATQALTLLHNWGFQELGLDRTWAEAFANNAGGIKTLEKLGYKREGVLRKHVFRNGERVDSIMWGLLREEWNNEIS